MIACQNYKLQHIKMMLLKTCLTQRPVLQPEDTVLCFACAILASLRHSIKLEMHYQAHLFAEDASCNATVSRVLRLTICHRPYHSNAPNQRFLVSMNESRLALTSLKV